MAPKLTIADVANALGVSKTTVSRAISGKGRISEETTRRVIDFIDRNNYRPNVLARGLAQQRSYNIGVICPTEYDIFAFPFFHACLRGIGDVTAANGYDILITIVEDSKTRELQRVVDNGKVDGVILTRTTANDPLADFLKAGDVPFAAIGSTPDPEILHVDNDHLGACRELTSMLLKKGCRRLALIGNDEGHVVTQLRRDGFEAGYEAAGIPISQAVVRLDASDSGRVVGIVRELRGQSVDGVVCMDEKITGQVMAACKEQGVRIPGEWKLASFYDIAMLANSSPSVTAIRFDDRRLGAAAAQLLLDVLDGREAQSRLFRDYAIIPRESTT